MKELSIEQKAQRYDEAIEKLRNFYRDYDTVSRLIDVKEELANLIPELKESDDERIRKWCISHFKECINVIKDNDEYKEYLSNKVIAWLEKQGEPIDKIVKRATTEKQRVLVSESDGVANIDWDTRSLQDVKLLLEYGLDYIKKLEKQGEQKHAWSEEDEKIFRALSRALARISSNTRTDSTSINYSFFAEINWLKSLKDRYTWKPSERQIKTLEDSIEFLGCTKKVREDLKSP